jgi:gentisate 1,2-dioxygenase
MCSIFHYTETSYAIEGERQKVIPGHGERAYASGGVVPTPSFDRQPKAYPIIRYPWSEVRQTLLALADDQPELEAVQVTYVNPETGQDVQNNLGFYALMLRPGQTLKLPVIAQTQFLLNEADTACAPGYTPITIKNRSANTPAFLFMADESPLHRKLGVYETRP